MRKFLITGFIAACLVMTNSCAGTKFVQPWRDPVYQGQIRKVFVLGVVKVRGPRSLVEEEFVRQLQARGKDAVASTSVLPDEAMPAREAVEARVGESGADAVLAVKFIRKESADTYVPKRDYKALIGFHEEWAAISGAAEATDDTMRDMSYNYNVVVMQTTVYDVASRKPVWSSGSETKYQGSPMHQIKAFVSAVLDRLSEEKLLK